MRRTLQIDKRSGALNWDEIISFGGMYISHLRYTDDTTLAAKNVGEMSYISNRLVKISAEYGLHVNRAKTKIMMCLKNNSPPTRSLEIDGIEAVNQFTYLGSIVENWGGCKNEILRRTQLTWSVMSRLNRVSGPSTSLFVKLLKVQITRFLGVRTWFGNLVTKQWCR